MPIGHCYHLSVGGVGRKENPLVLPLNGLLGSQCLQEAIAIKPDDPQVKANQSKLIVFAPVARSAVAAVVLSFSLWLYKFSLQLCGPKLNTHTKTKNKAKPARIRRIERAATAERNIRPRDKSEPSPLDCCDIASACLLLTLSESNIKYLSRWQANNKHTKTCR